MEKINIMVNGLPGHVAQIMARFSITDERFTPVPFSLTGQEIEEDAVTIEGTEFVLVKPDVRDEKIKTILKEFPSFITIDYTHPSAVNANADFYTENRLPFVMGTTGGDREALEKTVAGGPISAVIAPNMAKEIVGFQAMIEFAADTFPGLFSGYTLEVKESHQKGKADTSGTAKAVVASFNKLGAGFDMDAIKMIRDPEIQEKQWNIPKEHLGGHGWHTYTLTAPDGNALFQFKHNINGREIYTGGTFDAVLYLIDKMADPKEDRKLFTMIDVLNRT